MKVFKKNEVEKVTAIITFFVMCLFLSGNNEVIATETNDIGFSYHNLIPENQVKEGTFFDLLVKPNMTQELVTEVRNDSENDINLKISINDAKTNEAGGIEYGPSSLKSVEKNDYLLTDFLTGPTEVVLKKGEVKALKFKLTMPENKFKGVVLGGIQLEKIQEKAETKANVSIQNKYAYVFSVSLREDQKMQPYNLSSGGSFYRHETSLSKAMVLVNNNSQEIIKGMTITTVLTEKGSNKVLAESQSEDLKMAPKTILEYPISFEPIEVGLYQTKTRIEIDQQQWEWEDEFEVSSQGYEKKEIVEKKQEQANNLPSLITLVLSIIFGTAILFVTIKMYYKN